MPSAKPKIAHSDTAPNGKMSGPNHPIPRRKSEASAHLGDDSISHHYKGGNQKEDKLKEDSHGAIFESRAGAQKRYGGGR